VLVFLFYSLLLSSDFPSNRCFEYLMGKRDSFAKLDEDPGAIPPFEKQGKLKAMLLEVSKAMHFLK
jgi:hypothetical protein